MCSVDALTSTLLVHMHRRTCMHAPACMLKSTRVKVCTQPCPSIYPASSRGTPSAPAIMPLTATEFATCTMLWPSFNQQAAVALL